MDFWACWYASSRSAHVAASRCFFAHDPSGRSQANLQAMRRTTSHVAVWSVHRSHHSWRVRSVLAEPVGGGGLLAPGPVPE